MTRSQKLARQITAGEVWLPELGYALSLETALAIGTSSGSDWADCLRSRDLEKRLAGCNAFIAESKESSPDVARAYHGRGDAYYSKGDYDRAAADYDRATRLKFAEPYVVQDADGKILPNASPHSPEPPKAETAVSTPESPKTGFVINDRGDVVANNYVVDGCSLIKFVLNGQGLVQGRLVASDTTNDRR